MIPASLSPTFLMPQVMDKKDIDSSLFAWWIDAIKSDDNSLFPSEDPRVSRSIIRGFAEAELTPVAVAKKVAAAIPKENIFCDDFFISFFLLFESDTNSSISFSTFLRVVFCNRVS